jgi:hypothetical protein
VRLETCEQKSDESNLRHQFPLSASVFEVLLLAYLSYLPQWRRSSISEEPLLLRVLQQESVKLSALSLLPLLVENFGVLELIGTSAVHVFRMIYFILIDGVSDTRDFSSRSDLKFVSSECSITEALFTQDNAGALSYFLHHHINDEAKITQVGVVEEQSREVDSTVADSRISMSSLCLSLLLTILQLGKKHRVAVEEDYFRTFLPILKVYAQDLDYDRPMSTEEAAARSSMAEIAAHICVLIVSRDAFEKKNKEEKKAQQDFIGEHCGRLVKLISQAEQDLRSDTAPIRARGMVSLMRAARTEVKIHDHDISLKVKNCTNISESAQDSFVTLCCSASTLSERALCRCDSERMLQVAILAMEDKDSFVFLAAVQTLSSLCDVDPQYFLPRLTIAISRGILENKTVNRRKETPIAISISCRAKLCESLIFAIRRRGEALGHYSVSLVDELLRGCRSNIQEVNDARGGSTDVVNFMHSAEQPTINFLIEQQTHDFLNREVTEYDDEAGLKEEKQMKMLVGGPIFEVEELDSVRSGCYNCLAEIIMTLGQPTLVAQFIPKIVFLCLDALRLDKGRLVRRAAAFLSREVYRAAFREGKMLVSQEHQLFPSLTVELVISGEACLAATLMQMTQSNTTNGKSTYDPATDARIAEALELRQLCEEHGFLALASAMAKEREQRDRTLQNVPRIVQEMLKNSKDRNRSAININHFD